MPQRRTKSNSTKRGSSKRRAESLHRQPTKSQPKKLQRAKMSGSKSAGTTIKPARKASTKSATQPPAWLKLADEQLLDMRICDLGLRLEETPLVDTRDQLYAELAARSITLRPRCWLSDDWFSPDGIPGIAIPFYLAHPRLMRLERKQMLEVEGGTRAWCLQILRHEAGHAIDTAFRLHRRKSYKSVFGNYSDPYPEYYRPKPRSKSYVRHLEPWYAQSHPAEDFAETFAVWLKPRSRWRTEYQGWAALKKIEYVDSLMSDIAAQPAKVRSRATVDPVSKIKKTLREHYVERRAFYRTDSPSVFDADLRKLFPLASGKEQLAASYQRRSGAAQTTKSRRTQSAASFLSKNRAQFSRTVALWTGEYRYNINQVLREMVDRCRVMGLRIEVSADGTPTDEATLRQNLLILLTVHTMNYLHGAHHVAL